MTEKRKLLKHRQKKPHIGRGILIGLIAGLAASWTMNRFQAIWSEWPAHNDAKKKERQLEESSSNNENQYDATVKAAAAVSEGLFEHQLTPAEKKIARPVVHYAVSGLGGIVYCLASEFFPEVTRGFGLPYGTAFWLVVDEGMVPLLGLAKGPTQYSLSTHAYALASHLVFGATAESTRRLLRD